jgi:L-iditol 2-dehydrogenase
MPINRLVKLTTPGHLLLEEQEMPTAGQDEYVVKIASVGVCGSDIHYFEHGRIGNFIVESPLVLGHEASGVIVSAGPGADPARVGQRVAIEPGVPCLHCDQCRAGRYNLCPDVKFLATPPINGAFCDYIVHNGYFLYGVPDELSDDEAALCEPISVGIWANQKAGVQPGDTVLVTGAGPIGLLAAQVARERGARVIVSDIVPARRQAAKSLGFQEVHDPNSTPFQNASLAPNVLLECTGVSQVVLEASRIVAPAGRIVLVGMSPEPDQVLPVAILQTREISLTGTFRYANTYPTAIDLLVRKRIRLDPIITGRYALEQVAEALTISREDPSFIKPMVIPSLETGGA